METTSPPLNTTLEQTIEASSVGEQTECPRFIAGEDDCPCSWCCGEPGSEELPEEFIVPLIEDWLCAMDKGILLEEGEAIEVSRETMDFIQKKARNMALSSFGKDGGKKTRVADETTEENNGDCSTSESETVATHSTTEHILN